MCSEPETSNFRSPSSRTVEYPDLHRAGRGGQVEFQWLTADPFAQARVISEIVIRKWVDQSEQARRPDHLPNLLERLLKEMNFVLRDWVRPGFASSHTPHEQHIWVALETIPQLLCRLTLLGREIDVRVIGSLLGHSYLDRPPSCEQ